MLHITSFMQNIAKLNNKNKAICVESHPQKILNGLNRNYSFIYDQNLKRYDYHYENDDDDDENMREGYWGYMRDRNADQKTFVNDGSQASYDGYWGSFKDPHTIEVLNDKESLTTGSSYDDNGINIVTPNSTSPSIMSLSSSINSLSRFKDMYTDEDDPLQRSNSIFERYQKNLEYDYNYKTSKLKIQACKRDELKILMQSLEDQESKFKKEIIKSFDSNCLKIDTDEPSLTYSTKIKQINFLHFTNKSLDDTTSSLSNETTRNMKNFKTVFNTLTKLNKSINIFSGDFMSLNRTDLCSTFVNNVHASMNDINGFIFNYLYEKNQLDSVPFSQADFRRQTTNVSLCSNIYETVQTREFCEEKTQQIFGSSNHSTMLFEYQNVKIGFMALIDNTNFDDLKTSINNKLKLNYLENKDASNTTNNALEYIDFICECDKLSKQLRLCGANIIVVLTNMTDSNELRLVQESSDLDIVFSSSQKDSASANDIKKIQVGNRWIIKSGTCLDSVSMVSLNLDEFNSNKILDISIAKYLVE